MSNVLAAVLDLAADQNGLLTTQQAQRRGVSRLVLSRLAEQGAIERVSHGVYATPEGSMSPHTGLRAAWLSLDPHRFAFERLAIGSEGFTVTHRSAAELHNLGQLIPDKIEFVSTVRKRTTREDVRLRRRSISGEDITVAEGLPCTTIERTIADLIASNEDLSLVADALDDDNFNLINFDRLRELLDPLARRNGHASGSDFLRFLMDTTTKIETTVLSSIVAEAMRPLLDSFRPQLPSLALDTEAAKAVRGQIANIMKDNMPKLQKTMRESLRSRVDPALAVPEVKKAIEKAVPSTTMATTAAAAIGEGPDAGPVQERSKPDE